MFNTLYLAVLPSILTFKAKPPDPESFDGIRAIDYSGKDCTAEYWGHRRQDQE